MLEENIKTFIVNFFLTHGKFEGVKTEDMSKINFIDANTLDSIEFITLISEVEENFNVLFTEEDLQSKQFASIAGMTAIATLRVKS